MKPLKIMNDDPKTMKKHKFKYFHIENEWRYVPDQKEFEKATSQKFYINEASRKQHNKKQINLHKQISLKIDIEDIEYIIVKDKQDIDVLIDRIRKWDRKYNERSVDKLLTKIISMRHINDDF
jgi:predicted KAP-like P-loop ATPase